MRRVPLGRTAIVLQVIAAIVVVGVLLARGHVRTPWTESGHWQVRVAFADAGGLSSAARAPVTVAGVTAGQVTDVTYRDGQAIATLDLDSAARGVLRADAQATVAPRSALEDLTVDLTPGSPRAPVLRPGSLIDAARSHGPVTLDRVVSELDPDTRAQVEVLLGQLAVGLRERRGALRDTVAHLQATLDPAAQVTRALARRRVLLTRLSGELATTFSALGAHDAALAGAISAGRRTLQITAARGADVAATVRALPGSLGRLDGALAQVRALAVPLEPALTGLLPAARALPGALDAVRSAAPSLRGLVAGVGALARDGSGGLRAGRVALGRLGPTADLLEGPLRSLTPIVGAIDANRNGIGLLGERFDGVLSTNDADGTVLRGLGFFEPINPADFGEAGATGSRLAALKLEAVQALTRVCLHDNAVACLARYLVPGLPGAVRG